MTRPDIRHHALTKAEHDALELERPFTDPPIGWDKGRRTSDAAASDAVTDHALPIDLWANALRSNRNGLEEAS